MFFISIQSAASSPQSRGSHLPAPCYSCQVTRDTILQQMWQEVQHEGNSFVAPWQQVCLTHQASLIMRRQIMVPLALLVDRPLNCSCLRLNTRAPQNNLFWGALEVSSHLERNNNNEMLFSKKWCSSVKSCWTAQDLQVTLPCLFSQPYSCFLSTSPFMHAFNSPSSCHSTPALSPFQPNTDLCFSLFLPQSTMLWL